MFLGEILDDAFGGSIEFASHDDHAVSIVKIFLQWRIGSFQLDLFETLAELIHSDLVNLLGAQCCDPGRVIEDLRNDVARRSIPFELDNREIALAADRKSASYHVGRELKFGGLGIYDSASCRHDQGQRVIPFPPKDREDYGAENRC